METALSILSGEGIMADSTDPERIVGDKVGWYHSQSFLQAASYAHPQVLDGVKVRIILEFVVGCANSANGKAMVTRHGCQRYQFNYILIVPCSCFPPHLQIH